MTERIKEVLQSAAYTGNGSVADLEGKHVQATFYAKFGTGAASGTVSYETAPESDYAGTWAVLGTVNASSGASTFNNYVGTHAAVRARISTDILNSAAKNVSAVDVRTKAISGVDLGLKTISAIDLGVKTITAISKAAAAVVTSAGHGYTSADTVHIVAGDMVELTTGDYVITVIDVDTFSIPVDSTAFTTYTTGGTAYKLGTNPVLTVTGHGYSNGDSIKIASVVGTTQLNGNTYTVANKATDTLELSGIDGSGYTAYVSGGTTYKVGTYPTVTCTGHGYANGDTVAISDIVGTTELNDHNFTVANKATNTFQLQGVDGSGYTAYTSGGLAFRTAQAAKTITAISKAAHAVITVTAHGFVTGDTVTINPGDMVEIPSNAYPIIVLTANTFSIPVNSTGATTYTTGGTAQKTGTYTFDQTQITATAHGFTEGATVVLHSLGGSTELNDLTYTAEHVATDTFELRGVDGRTLTAYTTGGTASATGSVTVTVRAA